MNVQPKLTTERLLLRPFHYDDCQQIALLAGDKRISDMTANIPHPYEPQMAKEWIDRHALMFQENRGVAYAITLRCSGELLGAVSLPRIENGYGTLGYWLGIPHWGNGYTFEAAKALIWLAQHHFNLSGITVMHLVDNKRSKSVINKLGVPYVENRTLYMNGHNREVCVYQRSLKETKHDLHS